MKRSKDELLQAVREHGGDTPDEFTISLLEDIADSVSDVVDRTDEVNALTAANAELTTAKDTLQAAYDTLKKSYADRFTLSDKEVKEETQTEEEKVEEEAAQVDSYDSIF